MENNLYDGLMDAFAPQILGMFAESGKDKDRVVFLGELCRKHGVPFTKLITVLKELSEWEERYDNH